MKSQRRPGDPPAEVPGASIEAYFKPIQNLIDGQPGSRPIDNLLANLNELYRQLTLAASNPAGAKQALEQVDVQVASLRANVTRLPQPLAGMMDKVAKDAVGDATASSIAQIADAMAQDVTGACQQIVANRYPFFSKSDRDVPMAEFAKLFAPGGLIEKFYSANLDPLVNRAGKTWVWKPNPTSRKLSDTTLRQFQQAAEIRDAFFPTGGNVPNITLEVKPLTLEQRRAGCDPVDKRGKPHVPARRGAFHRDRPMARRRRRRGVHHDGAGLARPKVQPGAHWRMGAVSAHRRRLFDPERQLAEGQFRRVRPGGLLSVHFVLARQSPEPAGAAAVQVPERIVSS